MKCENCNSEHDGSYGSGRFCSTKCSRGFSTKGKRKEINEKVSKRMKEIKGHLNAKPFKKGSDSRRHTFTEEDRKKASSKLIEKHKDIFYGDFDKLSKSLKRKRLIEECEGKCIECGIDKWNGDSITLELHHKDGNNKNNIKSNLEMLCPNCHSLTDTFRNKKRMVM